MEPKNPRHPLFKKAAKAEALKPGPTADVGKVQAAAIQADPGHPASWIPTHAENSFERGKAASMAVLCIVVCILTLNIAAKLDDVLGWLTCTTKAIIKGARDLTADVFGGLAKVAQAWRGKP